MFKAISLLGIGFVLLGCTTSLVDEDGNVDPSRLIPKAFAHIGGTGNATLTDQGRTVRDPKGDTVPGLQAFVPTYVNVLPEGSELAETVGTHPGGTIQRLYQSFTEGKTLFTVDYRKFPSTPTPEDGVRVSITRDRFKLGKVKVTELEDTDLNVCGEEGDERCKWAYLVLYTFGFETREGLCSPADPTVDCLMLFGKIPDKKEKPVGHNFENAMILGKKKIKKHQKAVLLRHFLDDDDGSSLPVRVTVDLKKSKAEPGIHSKTFVMGYATLK